MPVTSAPALLEMLRAYGLLDLDHLDELSCSQSTYYPDAQALAKELVRRGWLTVYQVNQLLQDCGQELIVGPYILLDRLGQGGVSQVFKAWHPKSGRMLALKVIRPELLSNAEAVGRFHREMRAVARLDHPNIVNGFDISLEGDRHFFGMEFVEGNDLRKLVELSGPLQVPQACDYIRQAALGMQHAHEHGLIHRDIKPANLLLSAARSQIKILDMGLALFKDTGEEVLTRAPIGSADYLAPEQAQDSHRVDIRADIYSLGCTFYYLLTGKPPFAEGRSAAQKLIAHCNQAPRSVRACRPEVPEEVAAIIHKMLAKAPAQRYQTPAEVAQALVPWQVEAAPGPAEDKAASGTPPMYSNHKTTRVLRRPVLPAAPLKETRLFRRPVVAGVSSSGPGVAAVAAAVPSARPAAVPDTDAGRLNGGHGPSMRTEAVSVPAAAVLPAPADAPEGAAGRSAAWFVWLVVGFAGLAAVVVGLLLHR